MSDRKSISKKLRFEVFKRDSFTCQYCGKSAPEVILEVDHIKPVSKGGTDEMLNLITSCRDCNRGKTNVELSDDSVVIKQKKQLEELQERRNQIEMMMEWQEELINLDNEQVDIICCKFKAYTGCGVLDSGKIKIKKWLKKYTLEDLLEALDRSVSQYDDENKAFNMIPKIAYFVANPDKAVVVDLYYISGILKNRLAYYDKARGINYLKKASEYVDIDCLTQIAKTVRNWTEFRIVMESIIDGEYQDEQDNY